jgi:hypothetical protein
MTFNGSPNRIENSKPTIMAELVGTLELGYNSSNLPVSKERTA